MSDDTPTQRINSGDGDAPTQRIDTDGAESLSDEKQKSKGLLIGLVVAGGLLLLAIVAITFILLNRGQSNPITVGTDAPTSTSSSTPTPGTTETSSATPTPTSEPEQPDEPEQPQSTAAEFSTFQPKKEVTCSTGGPDFTPPPPTIQISWATIRADSAWIVQGTSDAADSGFMQIPLNGNQSDFQYQLDFPCFQADATYTITLVGSDGNHVSRSWTVKNIGDTN